MLMSLGRLVAQGVTSGGAFLFAFAAIGLLQEAFASDGGMPFGTNDFVRMALFSSAIVPVGTMLAAASVRRLGGTAPIYSAVLYGATVAVVAMSRTDFLCVSVLLAAASVPMGPAALMAWDALRKWIDPPVDPA
jgi:hypothetical protein